jgi:3-dehydroquinate synthase
MTIEHLHFNFGAFKSSAHITSNLPGIEEIARDCMRRTEGSETNTLPKQQPQVVDFGGDFFRPLLVCDRNTEYLAAQTRGNSVIPICTLEAGESHKNWQAVEAILRSAHDAGLGRDGTFIGVGGGVVGDL